MTLDPLLVDISPWCRQHPGAWQPLADAGAPWSGAIIKVSEGRVSYPTWFGPHWRALGDVHCVQPWLRGAYGFWLRGIPGSEQAHVMLAQIDKAGGRRAGDVLVIDVERSKANGGATRTEVEDGVSAMAATLWDETGCGVVLYAGVWLAQLGVRSQMGCELLWYPSYTPMLSTAVYERIGWTRGKLGPWQYAGLGGDGRVVAHLARYPRTTPIGDADISALVLEGGVERMLEVLAPRAAWCETGPGR